MRSLDELKLPPWALPALRLLDTWRNSEARVTGSNAESVCPLPLVLALAVAAPQTRDELELVVQSTNGVLFHRVFVSEVLRLLDGATCLRDIRINPQAL